MRVKRDGTRTIIQPVMEAPRWIYKALLTIIVIAQTITLTVTLQTPEIGYQIVSLILGVTFVTLIYRFTKSSETMVTISHHLKTATIQIDTFLKRQTNTYPLDQVELRILYDDPYPAGFSPEPSSISDPICLDIKLPDHDGVILDYDVTYVQWPIYLEKRAQEFAQEINLPLTYIARKPEVLLSDQYERQSNDEKYPRSL